MYTFRGVFALTAAAALTLGITMLAPAAHADDPLLISCSGTGHQTYDPGLKLTAGPTLITADGSYSCLGGGAVTGSDFGFHYTVQAGCLLTPPVTTGTTTITWNSGPPSTVTATIAVTRPVGQTIATTVGTVTAGQFLGYTVNQTAVYPALDLVQCATDQGVTSSNGTVVLTLAHPL
ncbi:hypothetical protein [Nocardia sp. NBC_01327]|uniref:hypothetical protein n=1 Tax=Nocardia sp. NBC_01327 TaxID=2903593 RepID=UPI002E0DFAC2|nr:hypothetical protein OG326_21635 [Nocardia sp. NBC_01327]